MYNVVALIIFNIWCHVVGRGGRVGGRGETDLLTF